MAEQKTPDFDSIKQTNVYGVEYWSARDLMPLLGYDKWERFEGAIKRALTSCEQTGNVVDDHFPGTGKPITGGKGAVQHLDSRSRTPTITRRTRKTHSTARAR